MVPKYHRSAAELPLTLAAIPSGRAGLGPGLSHGQAHEPVRIRRNHHVVLP
jgi:hypothetical protein